MESRNFQLRLGYLYPDHLNTYGDRGNVIAFVKQAEWLGIDVTVCALPVGSSLKNRPIDIYFIGGGQDHSQRGVANDLMTTDKGDCLTEEINRGVPLLAICGGFQLMGKFYQPLNGSPIPGLNIFPMVTAGISTRMVGNILTKTAFGETIGFENHSGETFLEPGAEPFGEVVLGFGNNHQRLTEGCRYKNAIGSYLHGPLLPKNSQITHWLLMKSLSMKYDIEITLNQSDTALEKAAFSSIKNICYQNETKQTRWQKFMKFARF